MADGAGWPVWYELMTKDPAAAAPFYKAVAGWTIPADGTTMPNGADYRWIEREDGGHQGGVLAFDQDMVDAGMPPLWAIYFHVGDVDAAVKTATRSGARVHMEPQTVPGAGRMAMLADPQGAPFYLITPEPPAGQPDAQAGVFDGSALGRCAWNELNTDNAPAQEAFYTTLFDWSFDGEMPMPGEHSYKFLSCGGTGIGAIGSMKPAGMPSLWLPYFRVADIAAAQAAIDANGGTIVDGPHDVPGGDTIVVARDPGGAAVAFVGRTAP